MQNLTLERIRPLLKSTLIAPFVASPVATPKDKETFADLENLKSQVFWDLATKAGKWAIPITRKQIEDAVDANSTLEDELIDEGFISFEEVVFDPVKTSDGQIYDRTFIERWLKTNDTSPLTRIKLKNRILTPLPEFKKELIELVSPFLEPIRLAEVIASRNERIALAYILQNPTDPQLGDISNVKRLAKISVNVFLLMVYLKPNFASELILSAININNIKIFSALIKDVALVKMLFQSDKKSELAERFLHFASLDHSGGLLGDLVEQDIPAGIAYKVKTKFIGLGAESATKALEEFYFKPKNKLKAKSKLKAKLELKPLILGDLSDYDVDEDIEVSDELSLSVSDLIGHLQKCIKENKTDDLFEVLWTKNRNQNIITALKQIFKNEPEVFKAIIRRLMIEEVDLSKNLNFRALFESWKIRKAVYLRVFRGDKVFIKLYHALSSVDSFSDSKLVILGLLLSDHRHRLTMEEIDAVLYEHSAYFLKKFDFHIDYDDSTIKMYWAGISFTSIKKFQQQLYHAFSRPPKKNGEKNSSQQRVHDSKRGAQLGEDILGDPLIGPYATSADATQEDKNAYANLDDLGTETLGALELTASKWVYQKTGLVDLHENDNETDFLDFVDDIDDLDKLLEVKGLKGPITDAVLFDPVKANDGCFYERSGIRSLFTYAKKDGNNPAVSPMTRERLYENQLTEVPEVKQRVLTLIELYRVLSFDDEQIALAYLILKNENDELFNEFLPCDYDLIRQLAGISEKVKQLLFHLKPAAKTILESPDLLKRVLATEDKSETAGIETIHRYLGEADACHFNEKKYVEYVDARIRGLGPNQAKFYVKPTLKAHTTYWRTEKHSTLGKFKLFRFLAAVFLTPSRVLWQKLRNKAVGRNQTSDFVRTVKTNKNSQPAASAPAVGTPQYKLQLFSDFMEATYHSKPFAYSDVDAEGARSRSNSLNSNLDSDLDVDDLSASLSSNF